jgi:hypothetical protein
MPRYLFECNKESGGCGQKIELECLMMDLDDKQPKSCPACKKRKALRQILFPPEVNIPCTLGSLADKNTREMSADERHEKTEKFNEYKKKDVSWISTKEGMVHKGNICQT